MKLLIFISIGYKIFNTSTPYSYRKNIEIFNITKDDNGNYRCENGFHSNSIELKVVDPEHPNITDSNLNDTEIKLIAGKHHVFYCHASGIPIPTIIWKKVIEKFKKLKKLEILKSGANSDTTC